MKINTTSEGYTKPQNNTACSHSGDRPETVTAPNAARVIKRYRLVCEGDYYTIKINKLSPDELRIAKPLVEDEGYDMHDLSAVFYEHGFELDIGNPNEDGFYDEPDANDVTYTLYDADECEIFSGDIPRTAKNLEIDVEIPPSRDGSRLVNFERCHDPVHVYALETDDVPRAEDFSAEVFKVRVGDETFTFLLRVNYKEKPLEFLVSESEGLAQDRYIRECYAIFV